MPIKRLYPLIVTGCLTLLLVSGCAKKVDVVRPLPPPSSELTQAQMKKQIAGIEQSQMPEEDKKRALATLTGQKDATERAEIQAIMSSTKTTPAEKNVELELLRKSKN